MSVETALKNGTAIPMNAAKTPIETLLEQVLADVRAGSMEQPQKPQILRARSAG